MSKRRPVKLRDWIYVRDCEPGDRMQLMNGRVFVFASELNNGWLAREVVDGQEGEFTPINGDLEMVII